MKINLITYNQLFPLTAFLNERIGFEASLDEGEDPTEVLAELKKLSVEFYKKSNNHLEENGLLSRVEVREPIKVEKPQNGVESLTADIESCKELKVLESYKFIAKQNPVIQEVFNKKLLELQK